MRNGYFGIVRSVAIVIGIVIGFNLFGEMILAILHSMNMKNASPQTLIMVNSIAQLSMMLVLPILIVRSSGHNVFESFRLEGMSETKLPVHLIAIPIITLGQLVGSSVSSLWMILLQQFPDMYSSLNTFQKMIEEAMKGLTTAHTPMELTVLLFGVGVIPAIAEESFFRGYIQTNIERSGKDKPRPIVALIITSFLFAAAHISPMEFPGLLVLGLLLGWLAYRTCDLRVSALAHAFNNGGIVIIAYLLKDNSDLVQNLTETKPEPLGDTLAMLGVSLSLLLGLLYVFQKMTAPLQARHNADLVIEHYDISESFTDTTDE